MSFLNCCTTWLNPYLSREISRVLVVKELYFQGKTNQQYTATELSLAYLKLDSNTEPRPFR